MEDQQSGIMIGYARVSTEDQRMDMQIDALVGAGVSTDHIFQESVSGYKGKRPELMNCLRMLRKGDTLVIFKLDRLGRSIVELLELVTMLEKRGVNIHSIRDMIDTKTAVGRVMFHMLAAFAQFERDIISERTKAGMKAARARGHRGGRKTKVTPAKLAAIKAMLADPKTVMDDVTMALGISRSTIQRALQRDGEKKKAEKITKLTTEEKIAQFRVILDDAA